MKKALLLLALLSSAHASDGVSEGETPEWVVGTSKIKVTKLARFLVVEASIEEGTIQVEKGTKVTVNTASRIKQKKPFITFSHDYGPTFAASLLASAFGPVTYVYPPWIEHEIRRENESINLAIPHPELGE